MAEDKDKITAKQQLFVDEYLKDLNAKQAAIRAGYSGKTAEQQASRLLSNVKVSKAIADAQKERAERTRIDQDWVLIRLKQISDRCVQAEPVYDNKGNETGEYRFDSTGANRATELIGKHLGMFKDNVKIEGEMKNNVEISRPKLKDLINSGDKDGEAEGTE